MAAVCMMQRPQSHGMPAQPYLVPMQMPRVHRNSRATGPPSESYAAAPWPSQAVGYPSSPEQATMHSKHGGGAVVMVPMLMPQFPGGQPNGWAPAHAADQMNYPAYASHGARHRGFSDSPRGFLGPDSDHEEVPPPQAMREAEAVGENPRSSGRSRRLRREQARTGHSSRHGPAGQMRGHMPLVDHSRDPFSLASSPEASKRIIERLELGTSEERHMIISWLCPAALQLSLSEHSCRVVQKVLDVAGQEARALFSAQFRGHTLALLFSPHGNHVLQKFVGVMPVADRASLLEELKFYKGGWAVLSRHKFGCRIEQRILEHFPEEMVRDLVEAIVQTAETLISHKFGNYVVQSVLEHGVDAARTRVVDTLIQLGVANLAQDRVASNVLERALHHCNGKCQQQLVSAFVTTPGALHSTACNRYGSFVVRQILMVATGPLRDQVLYQLNGLPQGHAIKSEGGYQAEQGLHQNMNVFNQTVGA